MCEISPTQLSNIVGTIMTQIEQKGQEMEIAPSVVRLRK